MVDWHRVETRKFFSPHYDPAIAHLQMAATVARAQRTFQKGRQRGQSSDSQVSAARGAQLGRPCSPVPSGSPGAPWWDRLLRAQGIGQGRRADTLNLQCT